MFFFGPVQQFSKYIYFSSYLINAKKKFWGVPHLLHMWVVFYWFSHDNTPMDSLFCVFQHHFLQVFLWFMRAWLAAFLNEHFIRRRIWISIAVRVHYVIIRHYSYSSIIFSNPQFILRSLSNSLQKSFL